jgi:hypothetical protein
MARDYTEIVCVFAIVTTVICVLMTGVWLIP